MPSWCSRASGWRSRGPTTSRIRSATSSSGSRSGTCGSCPEFQGQRFFIPTAAGRAATPLLLALIAVETTDLIFAVDSIPAIFAVTRDPFIVFTSNAFAILGLRSLYFLLADAADRFRYLKLGLAGVLIFVGGKMLLAGIFHVDPMPSLAVILLILLVSVVASLVSDRRDARVAVTPEHQPPSA